MWEREQEWRLSFVPPQLTAATFYEDSLGVRHYDDGAQGRLPTSLGNCWTGETGGRPIGWRG